MGRQKKQHLKQRKDGRYRTKYHGIQFMGNTEDEALAAREAFKQAELAAEMRSTTVEEYSTNWLPIAHPQTTISPITYIGLEAHITKLNRVIGQVFLSEVTPLKVKEVYSTEYAGLSNSYIRAGKQLFCAMFDAAVSDGYLRSNPARDVTAKPHKGTFGGHRAITAQEREWILTLCTDHRAHAAVMTMLYAGLRPQEMKALQIERSVDFENETITLVDFAHKSNPYEYEITSEGKTSNAARTIPLFPPLKKALKGKSGYLITNAKGERVNVEAWKCVWNSYVFHMEKAINGCEKRWYGKTREHKAILAAGGSLPPWVSFTVTPYDLRHSFCTMCRDNGVELNTCVHWMGHADAKMIMKVYDEFTDTRSQREAERLKKLLEGEKVPENKEEGQE
ncbi:MAG: tyrosine-type recombinase/integrase [Clostridia bacterium]|nr:tyrosine-type recombinase/integrase [Clostridia bacterium]